MIETIVATINKRPHGEELLVTVNFNGDLVVPEGNTRDEYISEVIRMRM